jgi:hypothetical protein
MKQPNFNKQIFNTIENEKTTFEELKAIEPILIENCKSSIKQMYNYYLFTIILTFIWFLIDNSIISEIEVININLNNKKLLLIGIPFLSISCFYFTITYMAFNQLIDAGLKQVQRKIYKNIGDSAIMELVIYPSLIELESIKVRLTNNNWRSTIGFIFISLTFLFLPIIVNGIICYKLFNDNTVSFWFPLIYTIILTKIISNIIFYIRQVI